MKASNKSVTQEGGALLPHIKIKMLQQMAEALEDEATGLYKRVAALDEEESMLMRDIEERATEINRLQLKLDALRDERNGLSERIQTIRSEATAMREEVCDSEEAIALLAIDDLRSNQEAPGAGDLAQQADQRGAVFFHRMTASDLSR